MYQNIVLISGGVLLPCFLFLEECSPSYNDHMMVHPFWSASWIMLQRSAGAASASEAEMRGQQADTEQDGSQREKHREQSGT